MPKTLVNINTANDYTEQGGANINSVYESRGGWVTLPAQVFAQVQHSPETGQQGSESWSEEFVLPSGAHSLEPGTVGIRFRSFTAGNAVQVNAAIFYKWEPAMSLGGSGISSPFVSVGSLNFQYNNVAVATEPTIDILDGGLLTWTVVDDPANTRVKVTPITTLIAPLLSPGFSGTPTAPTPATADNSTKLATTAYVQNQGYVTAATAPVTSVDGRTGAVTGLADLTSGSTQAFSAAVDSQFFGTPYTTGLALATNAITVSTGANRITTTDASTLTKINGKPDTNSWYIILVNATGSTITYGTGGGAGIGIAGSGSMLNGDKLLLFYDVISALWIPMAQSSSNTPAGVISVDGRNGVVTGIADLTSGSAQIFSAPVSTGPSSRTFSGAQTTGVFVDVGNGITGFNTVTFAAFSFGLTTDTFARFGANSSGQIVWGTGTAATDLLQQRVLNTAVFGNTSGTVAGIQIGGTGAAFLQTGGGIVSGANADQTIGSAGTFTPDLSQGNFQSATMATAGATTMTIAPVVNRPTGTFTAYLTIRIHNSGASGGVTITWGANYDGSTSNALPTSVLAGHFAWVTFIWDDVSGTWVPISVTTQ